MSCANAVVKLTPCRIIDRSTSWRSLPRTICSQEMIIEFPPSLANDSTATAKPPKRQRQKISVTGILGPPQPTDRQPWEAVHLPTDHDGHARRFIDKSLQEHGYVDEDSLLRWRNFGAKKIAELKAAGLAIKPSGPSPYRQLTSADRMVCLKNQEEAMLKQIENCNQWLEECRNEMQELLGNEILAAEKSV